MTRLGRPLSGSWRTSAGQPLRPFGNHLHDCLQVEFNRRHIALGFNDLREERRRIGQQVEVAIIPDPCRRTVGFHQEPSPEG